MEDRWQKPSVFRGILGGARDINVLVCESHPISGTADVIAFGYWHHAPAGRSYDVFLKMFPVAGVADVSLGGDECSLKSKPLKHDYAYLDADYIR